MRHYLQRWLVDLAIALLSALMIGLIAVVSDYFLTDQMPMLIASMGASVMIMLVVPQHSAARLWALFAGQLLSALVGLITLHYVAAPQIACMVAILFTLLLMLRLDCFHPPGAATALTPIFNPQLAQQPLWFLASVGTNLLVLMLGVWLWRIVIRYFQHSKRLRI